MEQPKQCKEWYDSRDLVQDQESHSMRDWCTAKTGSILLHRSRETGEDLVGARLGLCGGRKRRRFAAAGATASSCAWGGRRGAYAWAMGCAQPEERPLGLRWEAEFEHRLINRRRCGRRVVGAQRPSLTFEA